MGNDLHTNINTLDSLGIVVIHWIKKVHKTKTEKNIESSPNQQSGNVVEKNHDQFKLNENS